MPKNSKVLVIIAMFTLVNLVVMSPIFLLLSGLVVANLYSSFFPPVYINRNQKQKYMKSRVWRSLRNKVLRRDSYLCQSCGNDQELEVHHISYKNFGNESLSELVTVCRTCHQSIHDQRGYEHNKLYPIE